jgi:hypothetical protein
MSHEELDVSGPPAALGAVVHGPVVLGGDGRGSGEPASVVAVDVDGPLQPLELGQQGASGSGDTFEMEGLGWITPLPRAGELVLVVGWPEAGLLEHRIRLALPDVDASAARVVQLL